MGVISLFEIPYFLQSGEIGKNLLEESRRYKIGSLDWIEEMSKTVFVKYFAESEEVNSIADFINLMKTCEYWNVRYSPSLFVYYMSNRYECQEYISIEYVEMNEYTIQKLIDILKEFYKYNKYPTESLVQNFTKNEFERKVMIGSEIFTKSDIELPENIIYIILGIMYDDIANNLKLSSDKMQLLDFFGKLTEFYELYQNRQEIIEKIPIIPLGKNEKILNNFYEDKYTLCLSDLFKNDVNYEKDIRITISLNSHVIGKIKIKNVELLFKILNCLKEGKSLSYMIGTSYSVKYAYAVLEFNNSVYVQNLHGHNLNLFISEFESITESVIFNIKQKNPNFTLNL